MPFELTGAAIQPDVECPRTSRARQAAYITPATPCPPRSRHVHVRLQRSSYQLRSSILATWNHHPATRQRRSCILQATVGRETLACVSRIPFPLPPRHFEPLRSSSQHNGRATPTCPPPVATCGPKQCCHQNPVMHLFQGSYAAHIACVSQGNLSSYTCREVLPSVSLPISPYHLVKIVYGR